MLNLPEIEINKWRQMRTVWPKERLELKRPMWSWLHYISKFPASKWYSFLSPVLHPFIQQYYSKVICIDTNIRNVAAKNNLLDTERPVRCDEFTERKNRGVNGHSFPTNIKLICYSKDHLLTHNFCCWVK